MPSQLSGPGFENAAFDAGGADEAAGRGVEDDGFDAGALQIVSAGEARDAAADDRRRLTSRYGRNSRTICTTAFT